MFHRWLRQINHKQTIKHMNHSRIILITLLNIYIYVCVFMLQWCAACLLICVSDYKWIDECDLYTELHVAWQEHVRVCVWVIYPAVSNNMGGFISLWNYKLILLICRRFNPVNHCKDKSFNLPLGLNVFFKMINYLKLKSVAYKEERFFNP